MERRRFLQLLGLGVGGVAIEQAIPLGRVWSFPKEIVPVNCILLPPGAAARVIKYWSHVYGARVEQVDVALDWPWELAHAAAESCIVSRNTSAKSALYRLPDSMSLKGVVRLREVLDFRDVHCEGPQIFGIASAISTPSSP